MKNPDGEMKDPDGERSDLDGERSDTDDHIRRDYAGLVAGTWDLWRDNTADWEDRFFFLDILREYGEPVLDVGCGTGRLILDFLAQGIDVDGVDNSAEMLAVCREKGYKSGLNPLLYQQNMETLDLPRRYRTILVPSSSFQLLTEADAAPAALLRFTAHLQPGGALIMPFSFDWREGEPLDTGWQPLFDKIRPKDGARVRSWTHEWVEPDCQLWHAEQRFEVELGGEIIAREEHRRSPEGRWYSQDQVRRLYQQAGLIDIRLFQGFTRASAADDDRLFCALGVKP